MVRTRAEVWRCRHEIKKSTQRRGNSDANQAEAEERKENKRD